MRLHGWFGSGPLAVFVVVVLTVGAIQKEFNWMIFLCDKF